MANSHRGEVEFNEAGDGFVIRITNNDLGAFQNLWGEEYFQRILTAVDRHDVKVLSEILKISVRRPEGVSAKFDLGSHNGTPLREVSKKTVDALFLAIHGLTFDGYWEELAEKSKPKDDGVPLNRPDGSFDL